MNPPYNKIWSVVGLFVLYNSMNMYLYIQGSEVVFPFPDFSVAARDTISIYSMLTFIPSYFVLLKIVSFFNEENEEKPNKWYDRFPIAFNLNVKMPSKLGLNYQRFFLFVFLLLPAILQIHSLKEFFTTYAYTRDSKMGPKQIVASNFWEHLSNWQPNPLGNDYIFGDPSNEPVTYIPVIEPWLFLITQLALLYYLVRILMIVFGVISIKTN